jgi:(p)ppGpp synthase/HD superfamily hydrolase
MDKFNKLFVSLKYFLYGRNYFLALKALEFARKYHQGVRKDGVTKEFQHQLEIALYCTTLSALPDEEKVLATALLHDVVEDYNVPREEIKLLFGEQIEEAVWILTKEFKGVKKSYDSYFNDISNNPIAAIVKGADRIHNVQTMLGVFSKEKQERYLEEVETYFLPMIKQAKYNFPEHSAAFFNIQHMLKSQVQLFKAILKK